MKIIHACSFMLFLSAASAHAEMVEVGSVTLRKGAPVTGSPFSAMGLSGDKIPVDDLNASLGRGFDYLTGSILPAQCVDRAKGQADIHTPVDQTRVALGSKHEYIEAVRDMQANESATADSGGFGFTYKLVHLGGSAATTRDDYFNTVDSFAKIYSRFVTRSIEWVGGAWGRDALALSKEKKRINFDLKRFIDVCGTHYVRAVYYGSVIDQTIKFTLTDKHQSKTDKDSLTLGIGEIFGANYDHTDRETKIRNVATITFSDNSKGMIAKRAPDPSKAAAEPRATAGAQPDDPVKPIGGLQSAINYAHNQFPIDVAASRPDESQALYVDVEPYYRLALPQAAQVPQLSSELTSALASQAGLYERLLSQISNIANAQALPVEAFKQFYAGDQSSLPALLASANDLRQRYARAVDQCYDLIKSYSAKDQGGLCSSKLSEILSPTSLEAVRLKPPASQPAG